ncbi:tyrosine-type recombinase/integrase [Novosphingopyxis sp. YJ-S2-01]|uniref:tyrosine-type recombinase/integrase n=1 Tax=Novosphingopyxis sp. YJ-S2-01 TaxID=2794021 RepID=UPI0018DCE1CA|nr:integrase arm-type DNA-binding domain-containing protein [Novosphingopyxis sp. YJ-S2-01]MBH9537876.1 integrase arm-type DNA-binding domain-containing protein [Novosphingopyxis sp. YJ-S2-01]
MLTDAQCRKAGPREKAYKLSDGKGLFLFVTPTGFKSWRWKYRFEGKEKQLVIGPYPEFSLKRARELREDANRRRLEGEDPARTKQTSGEETTATFETFGRRWHENQKRLWSKKHAANVLAGLENEVFPTIGAKPIDSISSADIRKLLLAIQDRGAVETAHRLRGRISSVFKVAMASDAVQNDPSAGIVAALAPVKKGRHPAATKLKGARAVLQAVENLPAHPVTRLASRFLALTAARPGMVRWAEHAEIEGIDTHEPLWRVPAEKMKLVLKEKELGEAMEFVIPLAPAAIDVVRVARTLSGSASYLFPSVRHSNRPGSENALNSFYRRAPEAHGYHVPHGWRSSFSTIMNERAMDMDRPGDRAVIDLMLAHQTPGVEGRYNRAAYMTRRRQIAEEWAELLLEGFPPASALLEGPRR